MRKAEQAIRVRQKAEQTKEWATDLTPDEIDIMGSLAEDVDW